MKGDKRLILEFLVPVQVFASGFNRNPRKQKQLMFESLIWHMCSQPPRSSSQFSGSTTTFSLLFNALAPK